ncbi:polyamine ABC transporter permease [Pseudoroseomonas deserti]|uniref:Polyamine ABC transporter permease n=1 Tax=Teichococcus deserti TaxID=1817963 RepID=A0A1V2GUV3_9PROT|nr:ABC transporter permease [Pseudoroseomonas deserti]ONG45690.1 polyamine ABC transporter permease [Pseudoroseomonas deserti]
MKPSWMLRLCAAVGFAILLLPGVLVLIVSFSAGDFLTFPPPGLSFRWYGALLSNAQLMTALGTSAILAAIVATVSLLLGAPAAYAIARLDFPGRGVLAAMLAAPLLLPTLVLGLGLLLVLQPLGLAATWPGLVLGHCLVAIPFAVRIMTTAFAAVPKELEAAAWTLGATPFRAALRITLPNAAPGAIAAAVLTFLVSFDETVISLFLVGPRLSTLPVEMFRYAERTADPLIAALAMTLIAFALLMVVLVERLIGFTRAIGRD